MILSNSMRVCASDSSEIQTIELYSAYRSGTFVSISVIKVLDNTFEFLCNLILRFLCNLREE